MLGTVNFQSKAAGIKNMLGIVNFHSKAANTANVQMCAHSCAQTQKYIFMESCC
jgi:hypothetical protein